MKYIIKGNLCGYLCEECTEPLSGIEVLLYLPWQKDRILVTALANAKETFRLVSKDEAKDRKKLLVATAKTDAEGNYEFVLDDKFANTAFDIDFSCGTVPRGPKKPPRKEPVQFHITTIYPQWRIDEKQKFSYYLWQYCVPYKWWCHIRGYYFDAWVICGILTQCETGAPIPNAKVTAWDADFLTDDNLGSDTTDASGHFRIDYSSIKFKQTFLSPWINVETDPGLPLTFQSGPDVYFKASIGSLALINETKANRRNNVGYCLCVKLCTKVPIVDDPGEVLPSAWTGIGLAFNITTGVGPKDFDVNGYAGSGKYALTGTLRLTGQAASKSAAGNPIEYRFLVSDVTTPNGGAAPALANFTKVLGVTPGLFVPGTVSKLMQKVFPWNVYDVVSNQADFDSEGWFDINKSISRTLTDLGLGPLSDYFIIDEDTLLSLNTGVLTIHPDVAPAAVVVGNAVPAGLKIPVQKVAVRFEIREVVNKPANIFNIIPGSGKTLNSAVINNNSVYIKLAITELEGALCTPISGTVHAKYTVYHPHLGAALMHLNNNSYSVNRDITDGFLTLAGNINPAVDGNGNMSLQINNPPNDMTKCTYALKLWAQARMHNGDSAWGYSGPAEQLFFYNI
jgi:hypothetical protein